MKAASARRSLSGGVGYTSPIPTRGTFGKGGSSGIAAGGKSGVVAAEVDATGVDVREDTCACMTSCKAFCWERVGGADLTDGGGLGFAEMGFTGGGGLTGGGAATIGSEEGWGVRDGNGEVRFLLFAGGSLDLAGSGAFDTDRRVTGVEMAGGAGVIDLRATARSARDNTGDTGQAAREGREGSMTSEAERLSEVRV